MAEPVDNLRYGMEDLAWAEFSKPTSEMALCSIAVSLKRIADVVAAPGFDFATINNNIELMAWNAGRSFQHGTRTDK